MDALLLTSIVVLLAGVIAFVARPFYAPDKSPQRNQKLADLELEKQAKYAEIRDAEADFRAGKLSQDDYRRVDGELRAEAIEILKAMDKLDPDAGQGGDPVASR